MPPACPSLAMRQTPMVRAAAPGSNTGSFFVPELSSLVETPHRPMVAPRSGTQHAQLFLPEHPELEPAPEVRCSPEPVRSRPNSRTHSGFSQLEGGSTLSRSFETRTEDSRDSRGSMS
eukprot:267023-Rhodomonas_salina.1